MPIVHTYICDRCEANLEDNVYAIGYVTIKIETNDPDPNRDYRRSNTLMLCKDRCILEVENFLEEAGLL